MNAGSRGFTLAEALIATGILGLIGVLAFGTFAHAMDAREQATRITDHYHMVRQAMLRMSREISMAFLSEHRDCEQPRTMTIFKASNSGGGMRLDFTSFSHTKLEKDANESDQNELSYYVGREPHGGTKDNVLLRREQKRIDDEPDQGGTEEVLAEGISDLKFEFYNAKDGRWQDDWDTTHHDYRGRLPMFVRLELKTKSQSGKDEMFVTKTRVFLKKPMYIVGAGFSPCAE